MTTPGVPWPGMRPTAPQVLLTRLSGPLNSLLACGAARDEDPDAITLVLSENEAAQGGMVTISMYVDVHCPGCAGRGADAAPACARCGGSRTVSELFSAWLSVRPGAASGEVLAPSVELPGTVTPVRFRVEVRGKD